MIKKYLRIKDSEFGWMLHEGDILSAIITANFNKDVSIQEAEKILKEVMNER